MADQHQEVVEDSREQLFETESIIGGRDGILPAVPISAAVAQERLLGERTTLKPELNVSWGRSPQTDLAQIRPTPTNSHAEAEKGLSRDNLLLSEPIIQGSDAPTYAINCTLSERVADFVRDGIAPNSRRAYGSDLARFQAWGGSLPATDKVIATYLAEHAETHAASTLTRWLTSLTKAHRAAGLPDSTKNELVRSVLRGIRRTHGAAPRQAKPLLRDDLIVMLDAMDGSLRALRDRALLLIGFAGGFRRSELVGLDLCDVEAARQGVVLHLCRSKTDQFGQGRKIGVPHARGRHCPVASLEVWLSAANIAKGPLFRPVTRHNQVTSARLSGEAVSIIVRDRLSAAGIPPAGYSGHSLRAGFATSAAQAGISSWKIRQQTGHASDAMLARYIRQAELFVDNAAGALL